MNLYRYLLIKCAGDVKLHNAYQDTFSVLDTPQDPKKEYNSLMKDRIGTIGNLIAGRLVQSPTLSAGKSYTPEQAAKLMSSVYPWLYSTGKYLSNVNNVARTVHNVNKVVKPHLVTSMNAGTEHIPVEILTKEDVDSNFLYNRAGGNTVAAYNPLWHRMIVNESHGPDKLVYASGHEYGHWSDFSSPNTKFRQARLANQSYSGNDKTINIHGKAYSPRELAYLSEVEASKRGYQAMVSATRNAPKKVRNRLRRGAKADLNETAQAYSQLLNVPNKKEYSGSAPAKHARGAARDLETVARLNGINTSKDLDIEPADQEYFNDRKRHSMLDVVLNEGSNISNVNPNFVSSFTNSMPVLQQAMRVEKSKRRHADKLKKKKNS